MVIYMMALARISEREMLVKDAFGAAPAVNP